MMTGKGRSHIYRLLMLTMVLAVGFHSLEAKSIKLAISGSNEEIKAFEEREITYFSFSGLVDITGGMIDWETIGHRVTYVKDTNRYVFVVGSPYFKRNDSLFNMTYPAMFKDGLLYLPAETFISFLDQFTHEKISWSRGSGTIRIDSEYFNVTDMSISPKANGLLIEIFLTGALAYDIYVTEGNWVNVSIRDGKLNVPRIQMRRDSRYMYDLKTHQQPETGQISLRLKRKVDKWTHKIQNDPPRIQISIADVNFALEPSDTNPQIGPDEKIDVIVIDPGHGGAHYGAIGPRGTREKDIALSIAKELAKLIRKDKQFKVIMTRDRDKTVTLQDRADIANKASCDLFVSIHANSSLKKHVRGWNVFFLAPAKNDSARAVAQFENSAFFKDQLGTKPEPDNDNGSTYDDPILTILNEMIMTEFQAESYDFAMMVDREFRRKLKIPARGVDQAGFYVLNMIFAPSILVESGFISNSSEEKTLEKGGYQKDLAKAVYDAIKRFKAKYESQ
ncbi:MAG: N-acetylmuramoyl-L-alanine amidase [Candidatus Zixiibacteriota bacterium]|nr:MAG: N-acetylmuramoyl-L-alanine amidase [candidate division Zixibacteria bacterium]